MLSDQTCHRHYGFGVQWTVVDLELNNQIADEIW